MKSTFKFLYRQLYRSYQEDYNFKLVSVDDPKLVKRREVKMLKKGSIAILLFFLVVSAVVLISNIVITTRVQAVNFSDNGANLLKDSGGEIELVSNEVLVKIKKSVKDRIKEGNALDSGIESLNKINGEIGAKKVKKVAKEEGATIKNADIFSWYVITLDERQEKLKIKNKKTLDDEIRLVPEGTSSAQLGVSSEDLKLKKIARAIKKLKNDPNVIAVEPNYVLDITQIVPNDPYFTSSGSWGQSYDDLWGLKITNAQGGWNESTGSANIVVAVVDSGVDYNHADLSGNIWTNNDEIPGNSIDDDGNGFVDDYYGWDFVNNDNDPMDDLGHGTLIAGVIGAVGNNNLGVVGLNWNVNIMGVKFVDTNGSGSFGDAANAIVYAADNGARVANYSFRGPSNGVLSDAVEYAGFVGVVQVAAAGNDNNDVALYAPANEVRTLTVAATDTNDERASFSNYGEEIDVAAPGVDILSLKAFTSPICTFTNTVGVNYCRRTGTSYATPHVAGLAALILSQDSTLSVDEVKQIIKDSADDVDAPGVDIYTGSGRINAANALNSIVLPTPPPPSYSITLNQPERYCDGSDAHVRLTWVENIGTNHFDIYRDDVGWYTNNNNQGDMWESETLSFPKTYKFKIKNHDPNLTGGTAVESNEATITVRQCIGILGTVISTELFRQGLIAEDVWDGDRIYGALIAKDEPQVMKGYHFWARPVVNKMKTSPMFTNIVKFIATPVLMQIAFEAGTVDRGSFMGNLVLEGGKIISSGVGEFVDADVRYSTASN